MPGCIQPMSSPMMNRMLGRPPAAVRVCGTGGAIGCVACARITGAPAGSAAAGITAGVAAGFRLSGSPLVCMSLLCAGSTGASDVWSEQAVKAKTAAMIGLAVVDIAGWGLVMLRPLQADGASTLADVVRRATDELRTAIMISPCFRVTT